jgi:uncharacterized protein
MTTKSEVRDGMRIDWDVPITMDDGNVLRADIFRPDDAQKYPVLMTYGPYAKGLPFQVGYVAQWEGLKRDHPEILKGTSTNHFNWETVDPERWVPEGYVCIRVDSRGAGRSPGFLDPFSPRETRDYYECIEWSAVQPWCTGKVGLLGVSYYGMNQWQVAAKRPPHLSAICPFEGASDWYRDACRHGGILSTFWISWYPVQVINAQHGLGDRGRRNPNTGETIAGPANLNDSELARNRVDIRNLQLNHTLIDDYFKERIATLEDIEVPVLSCGNWGGQGLHLRGNVEGFWRAGSKQKWLEMHGLEHWTEFYTDYGVAIQKRFFDHFLKDVANGWDKEPPLKLKIRTKDGFIERDETEWPIARTQWTPLYLDITNNLLSDSSTVKEAVKNFDSMRSEVNFRFEPFKQDTEITGPIALKVFVQSTTADADIFATIRAFVPDGKEHLFVGAVDPNAPVTQGWLRASHRKLDAKQTKPYRPFHVHDEHQPLTPGETYELDIELWPTSFVFPKDYSLMLTISGKDFDHGLPEPMPKLYGKSQRGSSVFVHDDAVDRDKATYSGTTSLVFGPQHKAFLLLPVIPSIKR